MYRHLPATASSFLDRPRGRTVRPTSRCSNHEVGRAVCVGGEARREVTQDVVVVAQDRIAQHCTCVGEG
eukprot:2473177-Alexandrium_andersonii.AAC.1